MRILIGCSDVCGMIHNLGKEYQSQGHEVITVSGSDNRFNSYKYDLDPNDLLRSFVKYKTGSSWLASALPFIAGLFGQKIINGLHSVIIRKLLSETDCYIHVYNSCLWDEERQLSYLKAKGKKIITLFVGSDIRDYFQFKEHFNLKRWEFNDEMNLPGPEKKEKKLRLHERYSDAIFSVPDQSLRAKRPYFHLQLPLDISKFTYKINERDVPVVIHAPSKPYFKGTDLILETFEKLKREGIKFEVQFLENMQHHDLIKCLSEADVLVDELILHGPGFLSFEAMLSGCAVATRYYTDSPDCFKPPVLNINEDTIYTELKRLLTDRNLRIELAQKGREYALKNNNIQKVAADYLSKIGSVDCDYLAGNL